MNANLHHPNVSASETEFVRVLAHRYGDGSVYLPQGTPRTLYVACQQAGLLTDEGYLTRQGRELVARHCS